MKHAPALLISDVAMPAISGIDLAIRMKVQYPESKILLCSGQAAILDLLEEARSHGHDFPLLLKPVHPVALLSKRGALAAESGPIRVAPASASTEVLWLFAPTISFWNKDYESALREGALYKSGVRLRFGSQLDKKSEAKCISIDAGDHLMAHRYSCPVCRKNSR
jgi:hypothetical protein